MLSTLVINSGDVNAPGFAQAYEPLSVVSAVRAVNMIAAGRAVSLEDSEATFSSPTATYFLPYVVMLTAPVKAYPHRKVAFSRKGVFIRDNYTCVYCGARATTIDHVYPQCLGGKSTYENCVAACSPCNSKKDDNLLHEIGWELPYEPNVPSWYLLAMSKVSKESAHQESWLSHLAKWEPKVLSLVA